STAHCAASSEKLPGPRAANLSLRSVSRQAFPLLFLSLCGASVPFRVPVYLIPCFRYLIPYFVYLLRCLCPRSVLETHYLHSYLSLCPRSVLETHHSANDYVHSYRCLCLRSVLQTQPEPLSHRD
ncbi:hypothetical protein, partial [Candidatus Cryptobacteroides sp.]|uniref:hypothetical protein n=1 Tax=Candidatus Cryptobacteroides sp. TaxID=2952915 RepID=UPI002A833BB6